MCSLLSCDIHLHSRVGLTAHRSETHPEANTADVFMMKRAPPGIIGLPREHCCPQLRHNTSSSQEAELCASYAELEVDQGLY